MATVLGDITGIPFRVAASGSQFGSDGSSAGENDGVDFECKRYRNRIPRKEIRAKIAELALRSIPVDAWVLVATFGVSAQAACEVQALGRRFGIATFILDWTGALPRLAVALAMATDATRGFSAANTSGSVSAALEAVRADSDFNAGAEQLRRSLRELLVGTAAARQANADWLMTTFSSREQATRAFGEPLSPLDAAHGAARLRADLAAKVQPFLTGGAARTTLCVLGGEGVGKSWLVAHCWSRSDRRPLMVVLSPRDCQAVAGADDCEGLLASKVPAQAGGPVNDTVVAGWRRKLARWRDVSAPERPRLIVVIDGLNQRPQTDWARVIDAFNEALSRIGGRLVVTARTTFYETRLKPRLMTAVEELNVPEWTEAERDGILAERGIDHAVLLHQVQEGQAPVGPSLLNPRLLGIAVRLLKGRTVEDIAELSISHLLFEHLRTAERESRTPEPAHECVRRLRDHAREVLSRIQEGVNDDVAVFDAQGVQNVVEGRYFMPVDGDPMRYELRDDGLVLALGFVLLDRLRTASRNNRDLASELDATIDPVAALDQTGAVVMAALTCACVDDTQHDDIVVALLRAFSELQNPNHEDLEAFKALARGRSRAFLEAARHLCLTGWSQPNADWIEAALLSCKTYAEARQSIQTAVGRWLGCYSLSPESGVRSRRELSAQEEAKRTEKINNNLQSLSSAEKRLLESMQETVGDIGALSRLAFKLLAGGPLAPYAGAIVQWCLGTLVNQHPGWPYDEFEHLLRMNRSDWPAARAALLREGAIYRKADASNVGTWALIVLLRATGDPDAASEADELTAKISDFRPTSWRLVEKYCSTDPCDPYTSKPTNVVGTAQEYEKVDVSSLYGGSTKGGDEHFFEMARPGVVRFETQVAVEKHRAFVDDVVKRQGLPLRRGFFCLRPHSSLLTTKMAVTLAHEDQDWRRAIGDQPKNIQWALSQERLLFTFPKLSGEEQLIALLGTSAGDDVLRPLSRVMKPVDEKIFDHYFQQACREKNARSQYFLLAFARGSRTPISQRSRECMASLATSESALVRMIVFERIFSLRDEELMKIVVDGGWCAENTKRRNSYENAFGSAILVEGALREWISADDALGRISPAHYGWAASRLGPIVARKIAGMVDASIKASVGVDVKCTLPDIEYRCRHEDRPDPLPYGLSEKEIESRDVGELLKGDTEVDEAFDEWQGRRYKAFDAFRRRLDGANAWIVLDNINREQFEEIVKGDADAADRWYRLFLELDDGARWAVHNVVLILAYGLRERYPKRTVELLRSVSGRKGPVRFVAGRARVPLEAMVAWSAAGSDMGREWCHERLDLGRNDHELATEVLAALLNGEESTLGAFVHERLNRREPEGIARALLVAGFSSQSDECDDVLDGYKDTKGFIGEAYKAARYAYERDGWARHWFKKMCAADQATEFWRYSVLFTKIVDGRFAVWGSEYERLGEPMELFESSVEEEVDRRIDKWRKHREKTLFRERSRQMCFCPALPG